MRKVLAAMVAAMAAPAPPAAAQARMIVTFAAGG